MGLFFAPILENRIEEIFAREHMFAVGRRALDMLSYDMCCRMLFSRVLSSIGVPGTCFKDCIDTRGNQTRCVPKWPLAILIAVILDLVVKKKTKPFPPRYDPGWTLLFLAHIVRYIRCCILARLAPPKGLQQTNYCFL